jgi:hypothetical protein
MKLSEPLLFRCGRDATYIAHDEHMRHARNMLVTRITNWQMWHASLWFYLEAKKNSQRNAPTISPTARRPFPAYLPYNSDLFRLPSTWPVPRSTCPRFRWNPTRFPTAINPLYIRNLPHHEATTNSLITSPWSQPISYIQLDLELLLLYVVAMAQGSTMVFAIIFAVVAMVSTFAPTVLAQDSAPAPAPASVKGAACSAAVSGATILVSLFLSMLALLKH